MTSTELKNRKSHIDKMFSNIDGPLLARQRETLLMLIEDAEKIKKSLCNKAIRPHKLTVRVTLSPEQIEHLRGLQNLLDDVADITTDIYNIDCIIKVNPCADCGHEQDDHGNDGNDPEEGGCSGGREGERSCDCEDFKEET